MKNQNLWLNYLYINKNLIKKSKITYLPPMLNIQTKSAADSDFNILLANQEEDLDGTYFSNTRMLQRFR